MSPTKSQNESTAGCVIGIIIVAVIIIASFNSCSKKGDKRKSTGVEILGADPQAFKSAEDMFEEKEVDRLTTSEYNRLAEDFQFLVNEDVSPENAELREVLLQLDGARDMQDVNDMLMTATLQYMLMEGTEEFSQMMVDVAFSDGNEAYEKGDFEKAIEHYITVLEMDPYHKDARNNLGLSELHLGNNVAAMMNFRIILLKSPTYLGAKQNLSVALERMGLSEEAKDVAEEIVAENPKLPMALYNLGWMQSVDGEFEVAHTSLQEALKLKTDYAKAIQAYNLNKVANGEELSNAEMRTISKGSVSTSNTAQSNTKILTWVWWVMFAVAIVFQFILSSLAAANDRSGTMAYGLLALIIYIIAAIVFVIFFRTNQIFSNILWYFAGFNSLILILFGGKKR